MIAGPLIVEFQNKKTWNITNIDSIVEAFDKLKSFDREILFMEYYLEVRQMIFPSVL